MTKLWLLTILVCLPVFPQVKKPAKARAEPGPAWTQWGGPNRNFTTAPAALAEKWPAGGPKVLWKRPLGEGYSSLLSFSSMR